LFWGIASLAVVAALGVLLSLRSYQVFTQEERVLIVRCEAAPKSAMPAPKSAMPAPKGSDHSFQLILTPMTRGSSHVPQRFRMVGDQWTVGGEILKWHPWLNLVGIKSCHKLTRLSSRYLRAEEELTKPRSAYDLNGGSGLFWQWLHRAQRWIPFVDAVYGNSTYTMVQPDTEWGVYVSLFGYLIRPIRSQ